MESRNVKQSRKPPAADQLSIRLDLASGARIGPGKVAVLEEIARSGSISAAGRALKMSYRRTWELVEDLNQNLGVPVVETAPVEQTAPVVEATPVSYQTIANAYYDYTWQSLDRTRSFFEKLAYVRSPNNVFELQTEFAKQSYESFATESQKIGELHSKLASQRLKRWEDLAARMISPPRSQPRQA